MNYWQFKFSTWEGWKTLDIGESVEWQSPKIRNRKPNDIDVGDIVFLFRGGSGLTKQKKGIYFVTEVENVDFTLTHPIQLKVIKNLREDFFVPENYGFKNFVEKINKMRQNPNATYYKFEKSENPKTLFNLIINSTSVIDDVSEINNSKQLSETEKKNLLNCRIGQGDFRKNLIHYWSSCSVTQHMNIEILIASHIKPWKNSTNAERLDVYNGLLLIPNLDKLFDKGYISFDDNGEILITENFEDYKTLGVRKDMKITLHDNHKKYLRFHRNKIFRKK